MEHTTQLAETPIHGDVITPPEYRTEAFLRNLSTGSDDTRFLYGPGDDQFLGQKYGTFAEFRDFLLQENKAGKSISVCVNQTRGNRWMPQDIVTIRALFIDLNGSPLEPVKQSSFSPDIVVEVSPGRWHCYFTIANCEVGDFSNTQRKLAKAFNADPAVCGLPTVMRFTGLRESQCGWWVLYEAYNLL